MTDGSRAESLELVRDLVSALIDDDTPRAVAAIESAKRRGVRLDTALMSAASWAVGFARWEPLSDDEMRHAVARGAEQGHEVDGQRLLREIERELGSDDA